MQFALLLGLLHTILRSYKTMTFAEQGGEGGGAETVSPGSETGASKIHHEQTMNC